MDVYNLHLLEREALKQNMISLMMSLDNFDLLLKAVHDIKKNDLIIPSYVFFYS